MTAKEYAIDNGFADAEHLFKWHGMECYSAIYRKPKEELLQDGETLTFEAYHIGYPQYILERNGTFRFASYDEAMIITEEL